MSIKHVLQEDPMGCLVATFAMVLGITYEQAAEKMGGRPRYGHTYYCDMWEQNLFDNGWAVQRRWCVTQPGNKKREVWPPLPWADLHECEVQTSMIHSVLMLRDGTVLDPLTTEPRRLSDYERVYSVAALYPIDRLRAEAAAAKAEAEKAKADTARLDWLETEAGSEWAYVQMEKHGWMPRHLIDAARKQEGGA